MTFQDQSCKIRKKIAVEIIFSELVLQEPPTGWTQWHHFYNRGVLISEVVLYTSLYVAGTVGGVLVSEVPLIQGKIKLILSVYI